MDEPLMMPAKEAIQYVAKHFKIPSAYALAKYLSDEELTVQPIQITNYLKGTQMSQKVADRFTACYGITITDTYNKTNWAEAYDE